MSSRRPFSSSFNYKRPLYRCFTGELFISVVLCLSQTRSSVAFCPSPLPLVTFPDNLFTPKHHKGLYAQEKQSGGVPQYEKIDMVLVKSESIAEGSQLWTLELKQQPNKEVRIDEYKAGHVLAVEMEAPDNLSDGHTKEDAARNGGWMRGPYTVVRCNGKGQAVQIIFKVVGEKTRSMANAKAGTPLRIGGKFQTPIVQGIFEAAGGKSDYDDLQQQPTRRVVLISTGVGVGPCIGAVEEYLELYQRGSSMIRSSSITNIHLAASFRTQTEIIESSHLNDLSEQSEGLFTWTPVITSTDGRLSDSVENLEKFGITPFNGDSGSSSRGGSNTYCCRSETHYHLIGNGQSVHEWQEGLEQAGVPKSRVTTEIYFNQRAKKDAHRVAEITAAIRAASTVSVHKAV